MAVLDHLKNVVEGEIKTDEKTRKKFSLDASLFQVPPQAVIFPKHSADVQALVKFVAHNKRDHPELSLTARSAGTDMSGGPLNESLIVSFTEHMNKLLGFEGDAAWVQPGMFYRHFEKETLKKGLLLPSYPVSRSIAAIGGLVNNNSGGEMSLRYGKTARYVEELKMVLSDGNEYTFKKLSQDELNQKRRQENFEGELYRNMYDLLEEHYDAIQAARPNVSKNSAGYALWDVWDREHFDLTQLFVGAQGTLGLMTEAKLRLVRPKEHRAMAVLFLRNWTQIPDIVNALLPLEPEGLETFDDNTLKLALRFFPEIAARVKGQNIFTLGLQFLPEALIGLRMLGLPKLVVLVQFAEDSEDAAEEKLRQTKKALNPFGVQKRFLRSEQEAEKYWVIRRESFALLRKHVNGKRTAPFVDDFVVRPEKLPIVLPEVLKILNEYDIHATLAGHAGSGNFHIIPLMDLKKKEEVAKIRPVMDKIYEVVIREGGSTTGEHNDGLVRTPYLEKMYGREITNLFAGVKNIFDPQGIFNPRKKVGGDLDYAIEHINHT
ncbi:MAG: FAD-binding oxidoreductase [Candidatus Spechtbacterales bacterium]